MTPLDSKSFNRADKTLGVKPGRADSKSWKRRVSYRNRSRRIRMAQRSPMTSSARATGHLREYFLAIYEAFFNEALSCRGWQAGRCRSFEDILPSVHIRQKRERPRT